MTRLPAGRARSSSRRRRLLVVLFVAVLAVAASAGIMALEARSLRTHRVTVTSVDFPSAFEGLRIAFVSDVHLGPYVSRTRVRRVVDQVDGLHPDLVVLGGDYTYRDATGIRPVFAELGRLRAPLGIYGVLGNHDHWLGAAATRSAMAAVGIRDLDNRGVWLERGDARIRLCGVDDLWEGRQDLSAALGSAAASDYVVLVSHNPDFTETLTAGRADLVLSGHTHGGQVTIFGLWAPLLPSEYGQKYRTGLIDAGPATVVVTTGVGTTGVPLRFFARPEVVLLTLRRG